MASSGTRHILVLDPKTKKLKGKALCGYSPKKWEKKPKPSTTLTEADCKRCLKIAKGKGLLAVE